MLQNIDFLAQAQTFRIFRSRGFESYSGHFHPHRLFRLIFQILLHLKCVKCVFDHFLVELQNQEISIIDREAHWICVDRNTIVKALD